MVAMVLMADKVSFKGRWTLSAVMKDAGGLRERSPVTLAGIPVGEVLSLSVDPVDGRIRALVAIDETIVLPANVTAQLVTSGLFGDAALALSAPIGTTVTPLANDGSAVVEVAPAFLSAVADRAAGIMGSVERLLDEPTQADVKRLVRSAADLAQHAAAIAGRLEAQGGRIDEILANLERTSASLAHLAAMADARLNPMFDRVDAVLVKADAAIGSVHGVIGHVDAVVVRADRTIGDVDGLVLALEPDLVVLARTMRGVSASAARVVAAIADGQGVVGRLISDPGLARDLKHIAIDLAAAAALVADHPSSLVFDASAERAAEDQYRRDRAKMREAMRLGPSATKTD